MIIGTNMMNIYHHRLELINELMGLGHNVSIVAPAGGEEKKLIEMGVKFIDTPVSNRGTNPIKDLHLCYRLVRIIRQEKPDVVLTFYTKTNIYGGLACRVTGTPYIENITGLGTAVANGGLLSKIMIVLYGQAVRNASIVFFQNTANVRFFDDKHIRLKAKKLLPGSGVSLKRFKKLDYPSAPPTQFVYISRILREKGIYEYIDAARIIRQKFPDTVFHVIGPFTDEYRELLDTAEKDGIIKVHGKQYDIIPFLKESHCTIFPSFYGEGMANILLESAASGRPIITTEVPGCGEAVEDGKTGYVVKAQDSADLAAKIESFMNMNDDERKAMGDEGRRKMEREFDRQIVIDAYVSEINKILQ